MQSVAFLLWLDLTNEAPEGPGWYVKARLDSTDTIPATRISPVAAHETGEALDQALQSAEGELPQVSITQLVTSGNKLVRGAVEKALQDAQEQVKRIPKLQQQLATLPK